MNILRYARGRTPKGIMNKLESKYAEHLNGLLTNGDILFYAYERSHFRLGKQNFYTPDFYVIKADLSLEYHEVKGFWLPEARQKVKTAQEQNPYFKFVGVMWDSKKKGWKYENFYE